MNTDQRINMLLIRFQGLARQCRARLESGEDDTDLRERMADILLRLKQEEATYQEKRVLH